MAEKEAESKVDAAAGSKEEAEAKKEKEKQKEKTAAAKRVLGEIVALDFTENVLKIRRNLVMVSFVSIYMGLTGVKIIPRESVFLGLRFTGLTDKGIYIALLIVNAYLLVHFSLYAKDRLYEWKLRSTGTKELYTARLPDNPLRISGSLAHPDEDNVTEIRQSTLHAWWLRQEAAANKAEKFLHQLIELIKHDQQERHVIEDSFSVRINDMHKNIENIQTLLSNERMKESLERFNNMNMRFLISQNWRWLIFDLMLPVGIGLFAIGCLIYKWVTYEGNWYISFEPVQPVMIFVTHRFP